MPPRTRATLSSQWWKTQISDIRRCALCGNRLKNRFVPEEKRRRLVCQKCGRITYINPKVVAGLIPIMADGRLALLQRNTEPAYGYWTFPAGFMEIRETVEEAAVRETWEEIGVPVKITDFLGIYSYADASVVTIIFIGKVRKGAIPHKSLEAKEVALYEPAKIPWKKLAFRSTKQALKDWLRRRKLAKSRS